MIRSVEVGVPQGPMRSIIGPFYFMEEIMSMISMTEQAREARCRRLAAKFDTFMSKSHSTGKFVLQDTRTRLIIQNPHCLDMTLEDVEAVLEQWSA